MCNCNSNFDGDISEEDFATDSGYVNNDSINPDFLNYSDLHEEDADIDYDEGGIRQYRADGGLDYGSDFEDEDFENADGLDYGSDFEDEDFEGGSGYEPIGKENRLAFAFDGEEGDGQFDDFLTKRSRARRKLRKKLRKSGKSRSQARKEAVKSIPKQKIGKLLSNAVRGKTDPETTSILKKLESKGVIDTKKDGLDKVAEQISNSVNENVSEGTQNMGTETPISDVNNAPTQAGGGGNKKMLLIVGIGAVAIIGGYFAFFRN